MLKQIKQTKSVAFILALVAAPTQFTPHEKEDEQRASSRRFAGAVFAMTNVTRGNRIVNGSLTSLGLVIGGLPVADGASGLQLTDDGLRFARAVG